jgi:hypothetical protein
LVTSSSSYIKPIVRRDTRYGTPENASRKLPKDGVAASMIDTQDCI